MLLESEAEKTIRRPRYWTIARQKDCHADVFAFDPDGRGEALAVFGFEAEAELFLRFDELGDGWQVRETTSGELVSLLYGPCAGVERVVIDPLPRIIDSVGCMGILSISKADFTRILVEAVGARAGAMPALVSLRP
jgi:hypothetical protein